jgi:uncharacterized membrane protein YdbT with pleckstrin-like domain
MLLDIFVTVPSLLMTTIAWYIRVGLILICLIVLFAVAIGAIGVYRTREDDLVLSHRPRPKLVPGA